MLVRRDVDTDVAIIPRHSIKANYIVCSVLVGCNQGAITLTLAMASSFVGSTVAGVQSGVLFGAYTISALFLAAPTVRHLGAKLTLAASLFVQSAYVAAYLLAVAVPSLTTGAGMTLSSELSAPCHGERPQAYAQSC